MLSEKHIQRFQERIDLCIIIFIYHVHAWRFIDQFTSKPHIQNANVFPEDRN